MILGIMQPYFFPYVGYFDLINRVDKWIVFDVVAYKQKSWMNRNRVLHPSAGWQYVTVPVDKHCGRGTIGEVRVIDMELSKAKILGQLEHYRAGRAPYFSLVRDLVSASFPAGSNSLCDLNVSGIKLICEYLGIAFPVERLSTLQLPLPEIDEPGRWALEISSQLSADTYVNPPGGREIFDSESYAQRGIDLRFTELVDYRYETGSYAYQPSLSIIDVLMWNSAAAVRSFLDIWAERHPLVA